MGSDSGNAKRKRARRKIESELGRKLTSDEHVHHLKPLRSGGGNGKANLRIVKASKNLSDNGQNKRKK